VKSWIVQLGYSLVQMMLTKLLLNEKAQAAPNTYYHATRNPFQTFCPLKEHYEADVCIVGGGLTGVSTALDIAQKGYSTLLLESQRIGDGASGRNGGQLVNGFGCSINTLQKCVGHDAAKQLWHMTNDFIDEIDNRIRTYNIKCDRANGYIFAATNPLQMRSLRILQKKLSNDYQYLNTSILEKEDMRSWIKTDLYYGGLIDHKCGQIHPLNYLQGLTLAARTLGVRFFENSKAISLSFGNRLKVQTSGGSVSAKYVVLAGNAHLITSHRQVQRNITSVTSSIAVTAPLPKELVKKLFPGNVAIADCNNILDYYRLTKDRRLIFGAGADFLGSEPDNIEDFIKRRIIRLFPEIKELKLDYAWNGFIASTIKKIPLLSVLNSNVYFAQGFSGHGLALTGLAGKLISEAIAGNSGRFRLLADVKHRAFLPSPLKNTSLRIAKWLRQIEDHIH